MPGRTVRHSLHSIRDRVLGAAWARPGWVLLGAALVWSAAFAITLDIVFRGHPVTTPYRTYLAAAHDYLAHRPLYDLRTADGFQYLPQAAIAFVPIAWLGSPAGEIVWRGLGWGLYAFGLWRVCRRLAPDPPHLCFLLATCLAVGASRLSLQNGQSNLLMAALSLHIVAEVVDRRWWRAATLLAFGLGIKPLLAVLLLLLWALYRPLTWRIPIALACLLLAPLLVTDHVYLLEQYRACAIKFSISARPDRMFEDLRGLIASAGLLMPHATYRIVRLVGAVATLALCVRARRRLPEPLSALGLAASAAAYLMLLNPRTQSNSYVIAVCVAAALGATHLLHDRFRAAVPWIAICGAWAVSVNAWGGILRYWLKPLACVAFVCLLVREVLSTGRWSRSARRARPPLRSGRCRRPRSST